MKKEISCGIIIYQTNLIPRVVSGWFGITKPQKFFSEFLWVSIFRKEKGIKYLLLNDGNIWGFPKGLLEKGEDEKETAIREAKEETGLEDLKFKDFKERISYFYKKEDKLISKEAIYFLAETKQEDIKLSWEHKSYKWADFEEALKLLKFKNSKELLKKAHKLVNKKNLKDFFN